MATQNISNPSVHSSQTLEDTPARALEFLRGVGSTPEILRLMSSAGYTTEAHDEGLRLLAEAVGFIQERQAFRTVVSEEHATAVEQISIWYRTVFRRLKAALQRFCPEEAEALLANLEVSDTSDAVLVARIFLERLHALETDDGHRRAGHALVALLAERGFGAHEIRALKHLVETAERVPVPTGADPTEQSANEQARLVLLTALRAWYDDWSETARSIVVRRDHQIRLGLARRKARPSAAPPPVVVPPSATPAPLPAPALSPVLVEARSTPLLRNADQAA